MTRSTLPFASLLCAALAFACGSSDSGGLLDGQGGASGGGASGSGASGGGAGTGGAPNGGSSGDGGALSGGSAGASIGGAAGAGATSGGAPNGGGPNGGAGGAAPGGGGYPGGGGSGGGPNVSCAGHCGQVFGNGCQCDGLCVQFGDCCGDYAAQCGTGVVSCGNGTCKLATEFCCQSNESGSWSADCVSSGCFDTDIHCDGPEDCPGKVCCAEISPAGTFFTDFTCQTSCDSSTRRVICGTNPSVCPPGSTCKATNAPPGYKYCGF